MSMVARPRSTSQGSRRSNRSNRSLPAPAPSLTPLTDGPFTACAATASFFLHAQHNAILCLHHDTLAIERRFERHRQPVQWIAVDNVSEKGNGRLVVSYDASQTTIVWDLLTGDEVARFASYEEIRVAAWMRNGNIAFGKLGSSCDLRLVPWLIPVEQEIRKGTSYFSNHGPSSISPRAPFSIPSPPWLLERIAERSRSGMQF